MKIVITGGSGLIGTDLSNLLRKNHEVIVFDCENPRLKNINFIKGDIRNLPDVINSLKNCDVVIHLAATLGVINTEENPLETLDTNTLGTRNILEACRINNVKKIIFSSSSEIYGEPLKVPIEESDKPIPITTYGVSKLAAEEYIKSYSKIYGIRHTIFRLFNVYGDEQINDWVIPEFVSQAVMNEDLLIHGDGSQIRAFCYVSDVSNAFSYVLERGDNDIFNIGNDGEPLSIKELAQKIISIAKSKSSIRFIPFEKSFRNRNEILKRVPSTEKAKKILGYNPQISLAEGITRAINKKKSIAKSVINKSTKLLSGN